MKFHYQYNVEIDVYFQSDPRKAENFDSQFKKLPMGKTPPDKTAEYIISNLKGDEFKGFSFLNTEFQITHVSSL